MHYYDEGSEPLPPLQKGDSAWMQVQGKWEPVTVMDTASYHIKSAAGKVQATSPTVGIRFGAMRYKLVE